MLPSIVRIFVCTIPQDMRRSFDGLSLAAKELIGEDPQSGALFVFFGKRPTRIKILWWDRNGFCLLYKRLHKAIFCVPTTNNIDSNSVQIDPTALGELLGGINIDEKIKNIH